MNQDIIFDVMGNTSAFSLMGESSGYMITVNGHLYLLECGSPIFPSLGYKGIGDIRGSLHPIPMRTIKDGLPISCFSPFIIRS